MTMGEKILALRKARSWSQEELAERIGVTRQAVSRWESDSAKPDADKIIAVCDLFGVSADYLLRDQYSGENSFAQAEPQPTNALAAKAQSMTLREWYVFATTLISGLMLFALKLIYICKNTNYYFQDIYGVTHTGYQGFLRSEELLFLWYLALAVLFGGLFYLIVLPGIRKVRDHNTEKKESD